MKQISDKSSWVGLIQRRRSAALILLIAWLLCPLLAHSKLVIDLDTPGLAKMPIAVPDFVSDQPGTLGGRELAAILKNDLYLTGLFTIVDTSSLPILTSEGQPDYEACSCAGAQAVVTGKFQTNNGQLVVEGRFSRYRFEENGNGEAIHSRYPGRAAFNSQVWRSGHGSADRVPGCFTSRIIFIRDSPPKEIFAMDIDGGDLRQVTNTGTINMSPKWAPDGRSILFTSYLNRNPDLWCLDLESMDLRSVSNRPGINAAARFSPSGDTVALSLSFNGSPNIFTITPEGKIINRLTNSRGNDISPTWSPDGTALAYVSDQAGTPQIYIIPAKGGQPRRLTFTGNYNTEPDWSPTGDLIAFTARIDGKFQV